MDLNLSKSVMNLMFFLGGLFHNFGAIFSKALSPNVLDFTRISQRRFFFLLWPKISTRLILLKHLSHIHGSHPGSSRILIRGPPACNTTILSQCRCEYVANWAFIRNSTVSTRKDKAATRTSPERPRSEPGLHGWAREATGRLHGLFTDVHVLYWDNPGVLTVCWEKVAQTSNWSFTLLHLKWLDFRAENGELIWALA